MTVEVERAKPYCGISELFIAPGRAEWTLPLRADEPVFGGHYPGNPILPGIYTLEAITQGVEGYCARKGWRVRLKKVRSMRFLAPFVPGDQMKISIVIEVNERSTEAQISATAWRDETKAASAKLQFAILEGASC